MSQPKVSVLIPVYNTERYLRECLDSVINQTLSDIEIICINDGSTDGSSDILKEYAKADSRIKVIHRGNEGVLIARKVGIRCSTGKYVMFVDPDDRLTSQLSLETAYSLMQENSTDILQFSIKVFGSDAEKVSDIQKLLISHPLQIEEAGAIINHVIKGNVTWHLWNKVFNGDICRQAAQKIEDIRLYTGSDAYLFLIIAVFSKNYLSQKTEPLYDYRVGQGITTHREISLRDFKHYVAETEIISLLETFFAKRQALRLSQALLPCLKDKFLDHCLRRFIQLSPLDREQGYRMLVETFGKGIIWEKAQIKNRVSYWKYKILSVIGIKKKRANYKNKCLLHEAVESCCAVAGKEFLAVHAKKPDNYPSYSGER